MKRIGAKIVLLIIAAEIVAMMILYISLNKRLSGILEDRVISDMNIIAHHRSDLAETYIEGRCDFLNGYARSSEAVNALSDPDNPEYIKAARDYTKRYAEGYNTIEGLYIASWDTYVLAHTNPDSMDKTFREGDAAKALEDQVKAHTSAFCTGIVQAPVTKKMVMPVYAPVTNEQGEMIGFAGAAFYPEAIGVQLEVGEETKYDYSIINCSNHTYIYEAQYPELVGTESEDATLWETVDSIKAMTDSDKQGSLILNDRVMAIYYMPDYDWIFVVSQPVGEVFELVNTARNTIVSIFLPITSLIVIIIWYVISRMMTPIEKINDQIIRLENSDFSRGHGIEKFMDRKDEFGTISRAVMRLHSAMENQDELFKEMLDAQTAGMLVSKDTDSEIILINQMALSLYGIRPEEKDSVTIESIRSLFTEEELEHIDEQLQQLSESSDEVVFESPITHRDGTMHYLLTRVKTVTLSNSERVSIYSLMDITAQKELEEELHIQSETDFLTGICNRRSGEFRINKSVESGKTGMFCLFDANKFKVINDTYGHNAGDDVLIGIAQAMQSTFRSSDILIRLGGDEFVVYAPGMPDEKTGTMVINRLIHNIENISCPSINGHKVTVSLGAVMVNEEMTFSDMYSYADSLMYDCKKKGGSAFAFYK